MKYKNCIYPLVVTKRK